MSTAVFQGGNASNEKITAVQPDVIESHILTQLDGPSLASLACASSQLHALAIQENLWKNICSSTWPSVNHPLVQEIISTFPFGHRSFFSDSFPFPDPQPLKLDVNTLTLPTKLISVVDIFYQGKVIYSKVEETETSSSWFLYSPFLVNLLDPKDSAPTPIKYCGGSRDETWLKHLEENLSLSWIVIDPARKKAVNVSSRSAVLVRRHWLTGDVQVRFGTVMVGDGRRGSSRELVECRVVVTCGGKEGGGMHVREASMVMEDMERKGLNGKDSLIILEGIMGSGRRKKRNGNEGKEKYEEFEERKRKRKEKQQRKEQALDLVCITIGVAGFVTFCLAMLLRLQH
ncbi:F-box protein At2g27310-like [Durio zibethinus]|uniref:F-box protein At2g27310-like n=1 Tax=Durio zibethinus TaxID=66656 RepID=A0A6P5ZV62_DURZI|nr:F-box protein At2g27310-like [Durio zibethinus]